jgi:hypothetical protein
MPASEGREWRVEATDHLGGDTPTQLKISSTSFLELMREVREKKITEEEALKRALKESAGGA